MCKKFHLCTLFGVGPAHGVNNSVLNRARNGPLHAPPQLLLSQDDGIVHEVADDLVYVPPMEADLREFSRFHLHTQQAATWLLPVSA